MITPDQITDDRIVEYALNFLQANLEDDNVSDLVELGFEEEFLENLWDDVSARIAQVQRKYERLVRDAPKT